MPNQSQASSSFSLSDDTKKELSRAVWQIIDNANDVLEPIYFKENPNYELLFVTLLNNGNVRCCIAGDSPKNHENRLWADLLMGTKGCLLDDRFGGIIEESEHNQLEATFTFFHSPQLVKPEIETIKKEIELGVHAIEVKQGDKQAFFKESVAISKNYDYETLLTHLCVKANLSEKCYLEPNTQITKYETTTFHTDRNDTIIELYRYHPVLDISQINQEMLKKRLDLAHLWLHNNWNNENKMFNYQYYPSKDKYSSKNNLIRQMAAVWVLSELNQTNHESSYQDEIKIKDALDYYLDLAKCANDSCYIKMEDDDAKIAYNAFAVLILDNFMEYKDSENWLNKLTTALWQNQQSDGSFKTSFTDDQSGGQNYYPGEALLALMRVYNLNKNSQDLQKARQAFNYYRDYWQKNKNTAFIPWHTQAYKLLYEYTNDKEVANFVFEMNDWLIDNHQITQSRYFDEIGGFPEPEPKGCSTAVYLEGLNDAYFLAKAIGDQARAKKYLDSIKAGVKFLLTIQYTPDNSFYLLNARQAIGGFRATLTNNVQRVDYIQHGAMALQKTIVNNIFNF